MTPSSSADELDALHELERLVDRDDAELVNGVALSVDLSGENSDGFVGYRAKRHTGVVDIDRRAGYALGEFWEPIAARPDGIHTFRFDCSFHTWLYRIVTNICLDHLRKKKVRKEEATVVETAEGPVDRMDSFEENSAHADPERSCGTVQLSQRIETALGELTPRERMVFELRHYQGLRLRAIGEMLGTSEEAAKNCLFRATQKMRAVLGDFV